MRKTITIVAIAMLTLGISLSAGAQNKNRSADQEAQELEKIKRETTILKEVTRRPTSPGRGSLAARSNWQIRRARS